MADWAELAAVIVDILVELTGVPAVLVILYGSPVVVVATVALPLVAEAIPEILNAVVIRNVMV
jgi:hypothetical protein